MDRLEGINWVNWKNHPQTQAFIEFVRGVVQDQKDLWLDGAFQGENVHAEATRNARNQGRAEQAQRFIEVIEGISLPEPPKTEDGYAE